MKYRVKTRQELEAEGWVCWGDRLFYGGQDDMLRGSAIPLYALGREFLEYRRIWNVNDDSVIAIEDDTGFRWPMGVLTRVTDTPTCAHSWVNVGFTSLKLVCKHCDAEHRVTDEEKRG